MNESPTPNLIPAVERLPDALFGGAEALEDDADFESFWSRFLPEDIQFFNFSLMDQFVRRPFHAVMIEGPFDLPRLDPSLRSWSWVRTRRHRARSSETLGIQGASALWRPQCFQRIWL